MSNPICISMDKLNALQVHLDGHNPKFSLEILPIQADDFRVAPLATNTNEVAISWLPRPKHRSTKREVLVEKNSEEHNFTLKSLKIVIDNGVLQLTLSNPGGIVMGIRYNGIDNLLELNNKDLNGGFWDLNWSEAGSSKTRGKFDTIEGTSLRVIVENEEQVELSFTRTWDPSVQGEQAPLCIDRRFVVLRGSPGFYSYAIFEHSEDFPGFNLNTTRIAFMLRKDKFHYMAIADNRQRYMPLPDDRLPGARSTAGLPRSVPVQNCVPRLICHVQVDDKYQYSCENKDNQIFKITSHYAGEDLILKFQPGEIWKKVFGPVFIYLNSVSDGNDALSLWNDAKEQMKKEVESWPYSFAASNDFPKSDQRGAVKGKMLVYDSYISKDNIPAEAAYVGLAPPGDNGSWQMESKGYQFWSTANDDGCFAITNIRAGDYNLYAWVPGFIGDYKCEIALTITPGCDIDVGELVYEPPRNGPTLWEIGIPDRTAAEFYVPDPNPIYINKLYINHPDSFRQYGLWERYSDLYPDKDLVFRVGVSDYRKDWFYAQVTRRAGDNVYKSTTWQIKFDVENVDESGIYILRLALASAHNSDLQVQLNSIKVLKNTPFPEINPEKAELFGVQLLFITSLYKLGRSLSPDQLDINFNFFCEIKDSEWVIQAHSTEPLFSENIYGGVDLAL
ncbi:hypothetical protein DH2020_045665 [Rehmannia glutinosa]|uniref:Rhamnogalacturonan endolyase n=1 Tax=Rehmannia glutinosa TaxID=99300 RepID=A0ABR0UDN4_REHGL